MKSNVLVFEQFDDATANGADVNAQKKRAADYAEGFAAGEAAALSRAMEQNQQLQTAADALNRKLEKFDDTAAAYLCEALVDSVKKVFPSLCEQFFAKEAAAALNDVFSGNGNASLAVKTAPDKIDVIRSAISTLPIAERANVEADEAVSEFEVRAEWRHGGITFNADKAIEQLVATLEKTTKELKDEAGND